MGQQQHSRAPGSPVRTVFRLFAAGGLASAMLLGMPAPGHATEAQPATADPRIGANGKVTTDFAGSFDTGNAVVALSGGFIVAGSAGKSNDNGGNVPDFGLTRYDSRGQLDRGFGAGGKVTTDFFGDSDEARALVAQPDGKVIAAGAAFTGNGSNPDFALARYRRDGTLDRSFGNGGKVTTDFGAHDIASAIVMQPDGKLIAAGYTFDYAAAKMMFAVARYRTDGKLDSTFGNGGKVTTGFGGTDEATAVALQADGKLVVAGHTTASSFDFALARYSADGQLDASFGTAGKVTTDFGGNIDRATGVAVQADGKVVAVGATSTYTNSDFAVVRYRPDGALDSTFGVGGKVNTDFAGATDQAKAVIVRGDTLLVGGSAVVGDSFDFALATYRRDGSLERRFGDGGKVTTDFAGSFDEINALTTSANGTIVAAGTAYGVATFADFAVAGYRQH